MTNTNTRTAEFARNRDLDTVLSQLTDALGPSAHATANQHPAPRLPAVLILGPPRSGSTFLLQRLAATGSFAYPSNVVSRFHRAPYVGALAHRLLLDPALDHRGELTADGSNLDGLSALGKTVGPANVNEFWYAWRRFLPVTSTDDLTLEQLNRIDRAGLRAMVGGLEAGFERPVAMKALLLSFHAEVLAEIFPTAVFLRLDRNPTETIASILGARRRHNVDLESWWSLRPRDVEALAALPAVDQVAHQVTAVETALDRAMPTLGDRILRVDASLLRDDPAAVDSSIAAFLDGFGIEMAEVPDLASARPRAVTDSETTTIGAALDRARATRVANAPTPTAGPTPPSPTDLARIDDAGGVEEIDGHLLLYSTRRFASRNLGDGDRWLRVDLQHEGRVVGTLSGAIVHDDGRTLFWSGHSAPFGGPNFTRGQVTPAVVEQLVEETCETAMHAGASAARITLRPPSYSASEPLVLHTLLQQGFVVSGSELSCSVDLRPFSSREDYLASLKRTVRHALRKTADEPWTFHEVTGPWDESYSLLERNRARKGRTVRLPLSYLEQLRADLPGTLRCFELRHDGHTVAAAVLYRLLDHVESVQYWGDDADWLPFSPMRQLAAEVASLAIDEGRELLDLGKSSVGGVPDHGLVEFKRSIGGVAEPILTLERSLR